MKKRRTRKEKQRTEKRREREVEMTRLGMPGTPRDTRLQARQHLQQGEMLFQMGDAAGALRSLNAAVQLGVQDPACFAMVGLCHLQLGRVTESLAALQRAAGLAPTDPEISFLLASVLQESGQPQRAAQEYQRCVRLDPKGPRGREAKARLKELNLPEPDAADQPAAATADTPATAVSAVAPLTEAEKQEQAFHFARVCLESGLERRARIELEKIVENDPGNQEAWELLAQAFEKLGEPARAEECRQQAQSVQA